jgi:OmpR-family two-component system manganese-sensing response regulator
MYILLVDDETELTTPLKVALIREGYGVDVATNGAEGQMLAGHRTYDLLILDWMLPPPTGIEICRQLRQQGKTTPVLFLTAKDTLTDRVLGLDAGGDDYVVKPFELQELLARIRALLRRSSPSINPVPTVFLEVDDLQLDLENQIAYRMGHEIELSEKECQLLAYLMGHPKQLLSHEEIHQFLWGGHERPSSNVLAAQIRLLRRKIEGKGGPVLIHTIYGKGYRFGQGLP